MNKVISLMGPTASGKTDLAILLANKFDNFISAIFLLSIKIWLELNLKF